MKFSQLFHQRKIHFVKYFVSVAHIWYSSVLSDSTLKLLTKVNCKLKEEGWGMSGENSNNDDDTD